MDPPSSPSSDTSSRRRPAIITWDEKNQRATGLRGLEAAYPRSSTATSAEKARELIWKIPKAEWNGMQSVKVLINLGTSRSPQIANKRIAKYLYEQILRTIEGKSKIEFLFSIIESYKTAVRDHLAPLITASSEAAYAFKKEVQKIPKTEDCKMAECLKRSLLELRGQQWKVIASKDDDEFYYYPVIKKAVTVIIHYMTEGAGEYDYVYFEINKIRRLIHSVLGGDWDEIWNKNANDLGSEIRSQPSLAHSRHAFTPIGRARPTNLL